MKIRQHKQSLNHPAVLLLGASSFFCSQAVFSDATIIYKQISGTETSSNTMQIKNGKIRFTPPNQSNNYSLYDSKTGTITHVDSDKKHYLSMTEETMMQRAKQAKKQMDAMRQLMKEKMKDMPPEQRKQVEKMMNNHLSRVGDEIVGEERVGEERVTAKAEQKKTSRTNTIAGIQCSIYESYVNGTKINEVCMADAEKMGITAQDAEALISMQKYMKRMQSVISGNNMPVSEIKGVPLHTRLFAADGSVKMETQLEKLSTDNISSVKMSIPADFSLMEMPKIPGM